MFIRFIYTCLLAILSPILMMGLYKKKAGKPTIGQRWREHFGVSPRLQTPYPAPIWIHAVSVGETIAITPLIKQLKQQHPDLNIILTTTTSTGAAQAMKLSGLVEHRYMPFDFPFAIKRFIRTHQPQRLIIMETELWPNTLYLAHKAGIHVSVINARLSDKSLHNYQKIQPLFNICRDNIDQLLCQNPSDAERFKTLGFKDHIIHITGSIKYDLMIDDAITEQSQQLRTYLGTTRPVWIAASTHEGEEDILLDCHRTVLTSYPDAILILVPRHPERFNSVYDQCQQQDFNVVRRSQTSSEFNQTSQIYLADTMGEMLLLLGASDICFMGGSLIGNKVGGHNVLEPAALGIPCLIGPSYYNFKDITQLLEQAHALKIIDDAQALSQNLMTLFSNTEQRKQLAINAKMFVDNNRGAINKTLEYLAIK